MSRIRDFFIKNSWAWHVIILAIFVVITFVINRPPAGVSIAGGDFYQLIQPEQHAGRYFWAWINQTGQGSFNTIFVAYPYYWLLGQVGRVVTDQSLITSTMMFLFLYGSFASFYFSIKLIFPNVSSYIRRTTSVIYALNNFTLTAFTYPWGYTHHLLYYIFVPPLIALFYKIITTLQSRYLAVFAIVLAVSTIAYTNVAFLLASLVLQLALLVALLVTRQIRVSKNLILCLVGVALIYAAVAGPIALAWLRSLGDSYGLVSSSTALGGLQNWLESTSSNFINTFALALDKSRFPASSSTLATGFSMIYFLIVFYLGWIFLKAPGGANEPNVVPRRLTAVFLLLLVVLVGLSVRIYGPLKGVNLAFYQFSIFTLFRSSEKVFSLLPFVYLITLIGLFGAANLSKVKTSLILAILILIPFPFYTGRIMSDFAQKSDDFYHYQIKVPDEYYQIQQTINTTPGQASIVSLPYSVVNSINWSNYPSWGFIGQDILPLLYDKPFISANTDDHPLINITPTFLKLSQAQSIDSDLLLKSLQRFGAEFVLVHKDIDPQWFSDADKYKKALGEMVGSDKATVIQDGKFFTLYKLEDSLVHPAINISQTKINFTKVNNTFYRIKVDKITATQELTFKQAYSSQWQLRALPVSSTSLDCQKNRTYLGSLSTECLDAASDSVFASGSGVALNAKHQLVDGFANGWTIDASEMKKLDSQYYTVNADGSLNLELTIDFAPQKLVNDYYIILIAVTVLSGMFLIWQRRFRGESNVG